MQMFKCGHGMCKTCYTKLRSFQEEFSCPCCREQGQMHTIRFDSIQIGTWITFAEWYEEYENLY